MCRLHLKAGPMRDLFALIYNISKDGIHTYRASTDKIAEWLGCSERHAVDLIHILMESGYINREKKAINGGHAIYEYTTNYEELLRRAYDGEDIRPLPMRRRAKEARGAAKKGGESSPILKNAEKGGENDTKRVVKVPKKGGESSPRKDTINIHKDYYSSAHAREACPLEEEEKKYFYIKFFLDYSADPAAEVKRFIGFNTWKDWEYGKTPEQRARLAESWEIQQKRSAPDNIEHRCFHAFLLALAEKYDGELPPDEIFNSRTFAQVRRGKDDKQLLSVRWHTFESVKEWVEQDIEWLKKTLNDCYRPMGNAIDLRYIYLT